MTQMNYTGRVRNARILITISTLIYGVLPLLADLSETHVFHPDWPPHARLHTVWLLATHSAMAAVALHLMWRSHLDGLPRLRVAGWMGLCVLGGFCMSAATTHLYGGALSDPKGGGVTIMGTDANLLVFTASLGLVLVGLWLCSKTNGARGA